jgi:hypothetical protein
VTPAPAPATPEPEPAGVAIAGSGAGRPRIQSAVPTPTFAAAPTGSPPQVDLAPAVGEELAVLRERWPEVVTRISAHPPTKPLIAVCRPISVEDGVVTLGFPEGKDFLRGVAERRRTVLEEGIGEVLGRPVSVRCVATNLDLVPPLPADAEAAFVLAEAKRIFGSDGPDVAPID